MPALALQLCLSCSQARVTLGAAAMHRRCLSMSIAQVADHRRCPYITSQAMDASEAHEMLEASRRNPGLVAQIVPSPMTLPFDATIQVGRGWVVGIMHWVGWLGRRCAMMSRCPLPRRDAASVCADLCGVTAARHTRP